MAVRRQLSVDSYQFPSQTIRFFLTRGSGTGTAESSAFVYPCCGAEYSVATSASSDDPPKVHHGDARGDPLDHGEVVRDEQVGEAVIALQPREQREHLRLHRDVERGDGLVEHDELRLDRQRAGDRDALALPAGELVREPRGVAGAQPDLLERARHARVRRGALRELVRLDPLANGPARRACEGRATCADPGTRPASGGGACAAVRARSASTSVPSNVTRPDVGSIRRRIARPVVVFPHPDSPTSASVSPRAMSKLTSSTARTGACGAPRSAWRAGNSWVRWLTETSGPLTGRP